MIDATNDLGGDAFTTPASTRSPPRHRFVRAFNTLGFEKFADPAFGGEVSTAARGAGSCSSQH